MTFISDKASIYDVICYSFTIADRLLPLNNHSYGNHMTFSLYVIYFILIKTLYIYTTHLC